VRLRDIILASVCTLALAAPAMAQTTYICVLSGASESPANASPATGNATVVLNAAQTQLSVSVQFQNLVPPYTASHIHGPAPAGTNAAVKWGFIGVPAGWVFGSGTTSGTLTNFLVTGITPTDVTNLNNGQFYVNIHSTTFPGGELRGQLGSAPVPTLKTTWNRVKGLYR
jgi:hypothetical protein